MKVQGINMQLGDCFRVKTKNRKIKRGYIYKIVSVDGNIKKAQKLIDSSFLTFDNKFIFLDMSTYYDKVTI